MALLPLSTFTGSAIGDTILYGAFRAHMADCEDRRPWEEHPQVLYQSPDIVVLSGRWFLKLPFDPDGDGPVPEDLVEGPPAPDDDDWQELPRIETGTKRQEIVDFLSDRGLPTDVLGAVVRVWTPEGEQVWVTPEGYDDSAVYTRIS